MSDALVTMIEKLTFKLEEVEIERDELRAAVARIGEELKYKHDPEFQGAYLAWRGLTEEQREWFYSADVHVFGDPKPGLETMQAALRLLKAAGR